MNPEQLLYILGNPTRREILQMLATKRCYVSELAEALNVGQKAILEHLELMENAGILEAKYRKIEKGRPRKYFTISKKFKLEVSLISKELNIGVEFEENESGFERSSGMVKHEQIKSEILSQIEEFPELRRIVDRILSEGEISEEIKKELYTEKQKIEKAKRIIDEIFEMIE